MKHLYILILSLTSLCYSQNTSTSNYLTNGDFESGLSGWSTNGSNVTATEELGVVNPYTGSTKSIKLVFTNTGTAVAVFKDQRFINKDFGDFRFGFWIKAEIANTKFRVRKYTNNVDESGAVYGLDDMKSTPPIVLPDTNWHYIICNLPNVPANKKLGFQIMSNAITAESDGTFYVDDFRVHKSSWDPSFEMDSFFVFNNGTADLVVGNSASILTSGDPADIFYTSGNTNSLTMSYSTEKKYSGNRSMKVVNGTGNGTFYYKFLNSYDFLRVSMADGMTVDGSSEYPQIRFTASFKVMSTTPGAVSDMQFRFGNTSQYSAGVTLTDPNTWYTVTKQYVVDRTGEDAFSGTVYIGPRAKTANATYYFDDMEISWAEAGSLSVDISDLENNISFHPNPVLDYMNIKNYKPGDFLEIYEISGKKIYNERIYADNINLKHLNKGVYIGVVRGNSFKFVKK
ncbi:MAG: T9SS type A sorting domain-containing protein [Flavobacteriaceae bacterium]|nr:T9SS type A sorting domain-containing protein [Flavobacteriaceae bacterium]